MKRTLVAAVLVAAVLLPAAGSAQSFGLAGRAGSLGVGGELNLDLNRFIGVRGGVGSIPVQPTGTFGDVEYTVKPPSTLQNVGVDLYPLGGNFRLSGGLLFKHDIALEGVSNATYEINGMSYSAAEAGTLTASFTYNSTAPYATFGFSGRGRGFGLSLDFGAAFLGQPTVALTASGSMRNNATFQQNLRQEESDMRDKANQYMKVLPIVSLGLRFGI